jgi:tRNA A-37 threonylcarbamoyl transferase component Bud32
MIEVGHTVGNYKVTARLGTGGMGMVYLAEHPVIGRRAALKAIHPELARNAEAISRFVNEAKSISQIGHEHIVNVTDFGRTAAGDFYFIMEHLVGEALSDRLGREAPFAPARAMAIAAQIADALGACHERGVVHRDLKPENVFLVERGGSRDFVKVLDFGLAKLVRGDGSAMRKTQTGMIMGTPYYMSPEQCDGRDAIDARADVYALGVILFEMLTGKLPFGGDSCAEILVKQLTMRPPAARSIVPGLPEALELLLHSALAKDPAERFPTMAAFRAALLDPGSHIADASAVGVLDDLSGRVRAARPMARAELALDGTDAPSTRTTFREGVGAIEEDPAAELVPARNRGHSFAVAAAVALAGMALAAGLSIGRVGEPTTSAAVSLLPATIRVTLGSDPRGADVIAADGTALGTTPLSIEVPAGDSAVEYVFRKSGFRPKTISIIPNVSSPLFALLQAETPTPSGAATPPHRATARPVARARPAKTRHTSAAGTPRDENDADDVLAPTYR